jgi:hypothetical protein
MNNELIFKQSKIKSIKGHRFGTARVQTESTGFALYHSEYGFLSMGTNIDPKFNIELPYTPRGGRKVLTELLQSGLTDYNNITWVKPVTT